MNEYKKRLAQQGSQKLNSETAAPQGINGIPNSVLNDVFAGKRRATNEMMGHRVDPAPSVMARMSQAFGMDFSGVQVYRSDAMNGTGMHGMAQGNKVVLSSNVDLNTQEGQAVLGHEFSHIRAQSMGIGTGNGLLQDAGLEHQADNEGLLAARGMSISGESMGMSTGLGMAGFEGLTPLGSGMSATAAAPMQASEEKDKKELENLEKKRNEGLEFFNLANNYQLEDPKKIREYENVTDPAKLMDLKTKEVKRLSQLGWKKGLTYKEGKRYNYLKSKYSDKNNEKVKNINDRDAVSYSGSNEAKFNTRSWEFFLHDEDEADYWKKWFYWSKAKYLRQHGNVRDQKATYELPSGEEDDDDNHLI